MTPEELDEFKQIWFYDVWKDAGRPSDAESTFDLPCLQSRPLENP